MSLTNLIEGAIYTLREEGVSQVARKTAVVIQRKFRGIGFSKSGQDNSFVDVIFINGCDYSVPHPVRYRVDHQIEQLLAAGLSAYKVDAWNISNDLLRHARTFVIFRCPITEEVSDFIRLAKTLNKRVIYDIDDLVIDTKYTDIIPFVAAMNKADKKGYDDGVVRMGETLRLCDCAITTTETLADELKKYVPRVYINRNVASEAMVRYSEIALYRRDFLPHLSSGEVPKQEKKAYALSKRRHEAKKHHDSVVIGYFSGSITHNADFELVVPSLCRLMEKYPNVELRLCGELDQNSVLSKYNDRIHNIPFCDWRRLPGHIASCDINLAPLQDTLFNRAKSEIKWIEAALVKVPTVASNVGAFKRMVEPDVTGILCDEPLDWYKALERLVESSSLRRFLGQNAYDYCKKHCTTVPASSNIASIIRREQTKNIAFVMPSLKTSGGVLVALRHAAILQEFGCDVTLINTDDKWKWREAFGTQLPVLNRCVPSGKMDNCPFQARIDAGVATLWDTLDFLRRYPRIGAKYYLVQNFETDFYLPDEPLRLQANATYQVGDDVKYITISPWCKKWLEEDFGRKCSFVPNGIDLSVFTAMRREFKRERVRILIEGDCTSEYKNVDEAFRIVDRLDPLKYEVWYMSYTGTTKPFYRIDRNIGAVPHERVVEVYKECDILLKTSILESFSYPPLEMMATGGYVVAVPNEGNAEFLENGVNCLLYKCGDIDEGCKCIEKISSDASLREMLYEGGLKTASCRDWSTIADDVVSLYGMRR